MHEEVAPALEGREVQTWPALLSTEAAAQGWARAGAPHGAVVIAGYQASPRGRAGRPWTVDHDRDVVLSVVLRPDLPLERSGWLYAVGTLALSDVVDGEVEWPERVVRAGGGGEVSVHVEEGASAVAWAVLTILIVDPRDRSSSAASVLQAVDRRLVMAPDEARNELVARCATLGRQVTARLVPLGPAGPVVSGSAADVLTDGSLVIAAASGARVAVPPESLGLLEPG